MVGDVRKDTRGEPAPDYYVPYTQLTPTTMSVVYRLRDGGTAPDLAALVAQLDPEVAVTAEASLQEAARVATAPRRFLAGLLATFAAFAVTLSVTGLYGVISYAAAQRRREVAIRMALGADASGVVARFIREGMAVVASGLSVGLVAAILLGRALASQLHGVGATDPLTWGTLVFLLGATSLLAVWVPARRAARARPMSVLREE